MSAESKKQEQTKGVLSRRSFIFAAAATGALAGLSILANKVNVGGSSQQIDNTPNNEDKPLKPTFEHQTQIGKIEVYLPNGEKNPEFGVAYINIDPNTLDSGGETVLDVINKPDFRLQTHILYAAIKDAAAVGIVSNIGRESDVEPQDTFKAIIDSGHSNIDPGSGHKLFLAWKDFQFTVVQWDGQTVDEDPQSPNSSQASA